MTARIDVPADGQVPAFTVFFPTWDEAEAWEARYFGETEDDGVTLADHHEQERHSWGQV